MVSCSSKYKTVKLSKFSIALRKDNFHRCKMLARIDYKYYQKAKQVATISDFTKIHVGCVAVYQGSVIGIGCNSNKTHPRQNYYNRYRTIDNTYFIPKLHAEISCINSIRNLDINFSKVKLYIYRIRHDQDYGISRPCPSCMAAIRDIGIKDIYYSTDDGFAYERLK